MKKCKQKSKTLKNCTTVLKLDQQGFQSKDKRTLYKCTMTVYNFAILLHVVMTQKA